MLKKYYFLVIAISFLGIGGGAYADTLCPDPQIESSVVPSDLARVQEDIDRLSLCVERTKLLQKLNELSNESKIGVQPLSAAAIDPSFLKPVTADSLAKATNSIIDEKPFQNKPKDWVIRRVWGQGGKLQAQLVSGEGVLATVKTGEKLTDGAKVEEISVRGVKIKKKNGKVKQLGWQEEDSDGSF